MLLETDSPDGYEPLRLGEGIGVIEKEEEEEEEEEEEGEEEEENKSGLGTPTLNNCSTSNPDQKKQEAKSNTSSPRALQLLNQPSNVAALLPEISKALGRNQEEVARASWENARAVFCCCGGGGE